MINFCNKEIQLDPSYTSISHRLCREAAGNRSVSGLNQLLQTTS